MQFDKNSLESMIIDNGVGPKSLKQAMFIASKAQVTVFGGKVVPPSH